MNTQIAMREARENLADIVNRVAYGRERVTLSRKNKPMAVLISPADALLLEELETRADLQALEQLSQTWDNETVLLAAAKKEMGL